jgi:hypothetical protein
MTEIIFIVEDALEGGFTAKALQEIIFTEADTIEQLKANIKEAVECYFEEAEMPKIIC